MSFILDDATRSELLTRAMAYLAAERVGYYRADSEAKTPVERIFFEAAQMVIREEVTRFLAESPDFRTAVRERVGIVAAETMRGNEFLRHKLAAALAETLEDVTDQTYSD